ncbi:MAG: hypothetical protein OXG37_05480 [Actinomycetia bacterium]|nr:hypothetical protein [Actinomycetes bacterium]
MSPPGGRAVSTSVVLRELTAFPSCEAFLEHAQDQAIELVGPWGLPQYGMAVRTFLAGDAAVLAAEPAAAAVPPSPQPLRLLQPRCLRPLSHR